jgi:chromosome segregation ATPase
LDLSQATQLLTWLDEERRKDKALLMALQSQVDAHKSQLKDQARQLQEMEATLARVEGQLPKSQQMEESIHNVRTEFAGLLAKHSADHEALEAGRAQSEQKETETLARILHQVQERVEALGSFEHTMVLLGEEDGKLRGELTKAVSSIADLSKRQDAYEPRISLLEKDAALFRDGVTSARMTAEELNDKIMSLRVALDSVGQSLDAKIEQLQSSFEDVNRKRATEFESLQARQQEQVSLLGELEEKVAVLHAPMARWTKQMEEFTVQFERNRKALYDLRELEKQVRQQGDEMLELQRVTAERVRTELREWRDGQAKVDEEQTAHLQLLEAWQSKINEASQGLEARLEQNRQDIGACADRLWRTWTDYMQGQIKLLESIVKQRKEV